MTDLATIARSELAPVPHRLARSILIAVLCGFVVVASKHLSLPETALSAYLIFFASKEESTLSVATAFALILVTFVALGLVIMLMMLSGGTPLLRILVMFCIAFGSMYVAGMISAGVIVATLGMVFFEILSLMDYVPYPDLVLRGLFWLPTIVIIPMGLLIIASLVFGRSAIDILSKRLSQHLGLIARVMAKPNAANIAACRTAFLEGGEELTTLRQTARMTGRLTKETALKAIWVQDVTTRLLGQCAAGKPPENTANNRAALALPDDLNPESTPEDVLLQELILQTYDDFPEIESGIDEGKNPQETMRFAIKATISIAICYAIFTMLHWPAIHTITITAFLVAIGTTAETLHKALLRLTGCLIGAVISFFCLIVIIPNLTSAGELAVLTALVALPAAWITVGRENTAYIGMQVALVFFLSVLNTNGPDVDLGVTWGRVIGIVLGNLVVAGVFLTLWPNDPMEVIEEDLDNAITVLGKVDNIGLGQGILLGEASDALRKADAALTQTNLGGSIGFATHKRAQYLRQIHRELENLIISATVPRNIQSETLGRLRNRLHTAPVGSEPVSEGV